MTDVTKSYIPMSQYLDLTATSASQIKDVHAKGLWWSKFAPKRESTSAQEVGSYIHAYLLNQQDELEQFVIEPANSDRRTKAYKEWASQHTDKTIIKNETFVMALGMQGSLDAHGLAGLLKGEPEVTFVENVTGFNRKCRPDVYNETKKLIVDLKTCEDVDAFRYDFKKYNYAMSEPHYLDIIGNDYTYIWLVVEKKQPHRWQWYVTSEETRDLARKNYDAAWESWCQAMRDGVWATRAGDEPLEL